LGLYLHHAEDEPSLASFEYQQAAGGPGLDSETWDSGTMEGRVEFHIYDVFHRLCEQYVFSPRCCPK